MHWNYCAMQTILDKAIRVQVWRAKNRPGLSPWSVTKRRRLTEHACTATARTGEAEQTGMRTTTVHVWAARVGLCNKWCGIFSVFLE